MIQRTLEKKVIQLSKKFPVVAILGPRQSGKTTLAKIVFPKKPYISLEDTDTRNFAIQDPRGFLKQYVRGAILDEIQRTPELFSYLQTSIDQQSTPGRFILTGSHNYLLQEQLSQTLAGRVAMVTLLPLSMEELQHAHLIPKSIEGTLFRGTYPRVYNQTIRPTDWYPNYLRTYVERDIRLMKNITDLHTFETFIALCAGRTGQLLNLSSLGNDCGISHNTARAWVSLLESSYIIFLLRPYHTNVNKRMIKAPKLYFYDTGLACSLLGIERAEQLRTHYLYGSLVETFILSDLMKQRMHRGMNPELYFWRDQQGHEIDCIVKRGTGTQLIEIKSGATVADDFFRGIRYWKKIAGSKHTVASVIYGGDGDQQRSDVSVYSWRTMGRLLQ